MLWTLIKKQYRECFRGYFINTKTGKARSKGGLIGMFVFFAVLMLYLGGAFFGVAFMLSELLATPFAWVYYALLGTLAVALGTFGSVFSTYSVLYIAKDNEFLLSLPIPPVMILFTRITLAYGMSLLYSSLVWIPAIISGWIFGGATVGNVVFGILLTPLIALFVTVFTCLLGWVVAIVSTRLKNRNYIIVLLTLGLIGGYMYLVNRMQEFFLNLITNVEAIGSGMRVWGFPLYQLGMAANGDAVAMLVFTAITAVLFCICFAVLSRTFLRIAISGGAAVKKNDRVTIRTAGVRKALLAREWKRFTSSTAYMLNCGFGLVMLLVVAVMSLIQRETLMTALAELTAFIPSLDSLRPLLVLLSVGVVGGTCTISAPSVSLEGKNLWVLRSLPVRGADVLAAKLKLHLLLTLPLILVSAIAMSFVLGLNPEEIMIATGCCLALGWFLGAFGLLIGLLNPNFSWTTETTPVKQSLNVFISMAAGLLVPMLCAAVCYLLTEWLELREAMTGVTVLVAFAAAWITRWLGSEGGKVFDRL